MSLAEEKSPSPASAKQLRQKRSVDRAPLRVSVELETTDGRQISAVSKSVGLGSLVVSCKPGLEIGTELVVHLPLPKLGRSPLTGFVDWTFSGGVGIRLGAMGARETHALGVLVLASRNTEISEPFAKAVSVPQEKGRRHPITRARSIVSAVIDE